jgi:hypothetical protein
MSRFIMLIREVNLALLTVAALSPCILLPEQEA